MVAFVAASQQCAAAVVVVVSIVPYSTYLSTVLSVVSLPVEVVALAVDGAVVPMLASAVAVAVLKGNTQHLLPILRIRELQCFYYCLQHYLPAYCRYNSQQQGLPR